MIEVILFGSIATGQATIRSDADLMIVLREHPSAPRDRIPEYLDAFLAAPVPGDVFPFTTEELKIRRGRRDPFLETIDRRGIELLRPSGPSGP